MIEVYKLIQMRVNQLVKLDKAELLAGHSAVTDAIQDAMEDVKNSFEQSDITDYSKEAVQQALKDAEAAYLFFNKYNELRMLSYLNRNLR